MNNTSIAHPRQYAVSRQFPFPCVPRYKFLKMLPLYGKHFTQPPSLQPRLFFGCNPIYLIVKVLASFRFLFIRSSVASDPLIRSFLSYNARTPCYIKILYQNCKPMTDNLLRQLSSHVHPTGRVVGLPADKAKNLRGQMSLSIRVGRQLIL